jgi:hypothetical protein
MAPFSRSLNILDERLNDILKEIDHLMRLQIVHILVKNSEGRLSRFNSFAFDLNLHGLDSLFRAFLA